MLSQQVNLEPRIHPMMPNIKLSVLKIIVIGQPFRQSSYRLITIMQWKH